MGTLALAVMLLALALGVAWILAWPVLGLWARVLGAARRPTLRRFNIVMLAAPLILGAGVALGAVWPSESLVWGSWACHCVLGQASSYHLCLAHTSEALPLLPLATFWLVWLGWRPVRESVSVFRRLRAARRLVAAGGDQVMEHDCPVRLLDLDSANAFTVGLLRPSVVADRCWWRGLSAMERRIVAAHEAAHVWCMDPLSHTVALLLCGLIPARVATPLVEGWLAWAEQRADARAAQVVGDAASVAELLLRQYRQHATPSLVPAFGGGGLEARVTALLHFDGAAPRLASDIGRGLLLCGATTLLVVGLLGFQIHHWVERLLLLFS